MASIPWWVAYNYTTLTGYVFQAPNLKDADNEALGSGDINATTYGFKTRAAAVAWATADGITLPGAGGQHPQPPQQPPGGPQPRGGRIDRNTIVVVTHWVLNQQGHCYRYGGAPGPNFTGCPDCSSFCNFAWGRIGQQSIPGYPDGSYDGTVHGPSTVTWLGSQGSITGSVPRDQAQAGDLATWQTHMGYCISNQEMVSAQTPANGVRRSGIDGFIPGEQLVILRLAVIGPGGITLPLLGLGDARQVDAVTRQIAEASRMLVNMRMRLYAAGKPNGRA